MKKIVTCLVVVLTILTAFCSFKRAGTSSVFIPSIRISNADYSLSISETNIPLLKDTVFGGNKCLMTKCPLTLTNNSDDTLKYAGMSASWWEFYSLDNKNFALGADYWNVFKNGPVVYILSPHRSVTKNIEIITYKDYFRGGRLRIAMRIQKVVKLPIVGNIVSINSDSNYLIWSNEVVIR